MGDVRVAGTPSTGAFSADLGYTYEQQRERLRKQLQPIGNQAKVAEFHERFGYDVNEKPTERSWAQMMFRDDLIKEECDELRHELGRAKPDIVKVAHEAADLLYVVYGVACEMGFDLDAVLGEIHRANMAKTPSGDALRKTTKPAGWKPADVESVVNG